MLLPLLPAAFGADAATAQLTITLPSASAWVLPNVMAGAIDPFARMAGLAAAGAGVVQRTGSALYAIAVSHTDDGTLRPMTTAVAAAGLAAFVTFAWLLRRRVVLQNTEGRVP